MAADNSTDLFTCGVCYEDYDEYERKPKMLECHHTYCTSCLESLYERTDKKRVVCPSCSVSTKPGRSGIIGLSTNHYLNKFSDVLKTADANSRLANQKGGHSSSWTTDGDDGLQKLCSSLVLSCQKHAQSEGLMWCLNCQIIVCRNCQREDHRTANGHVIVNLCRASEELKGDVLELLSHLKNTMEDFQEEQNQLATLVEKLARRTNLAVRTAIQGPHQRLSSEIEELDSCVNLEIKELGKIDFTDPTSVTINRWIELNRKLSDLMSSVQNFRPKVNAQKEEAAFLSNSQILVTFLPKNKDPGRGGAARPGPGLLNKSELFCPECRVACQENENGTTSSCQRCRAITFTMSI